MDRRSVTTADRPDNYMAYMITGGLNVGISRYNDSWKVLRKAAQAILTPQAIYQHLPIQKAEATQLMYDCLKSPKVSPSTSSTVFCSSRLTCMIAGLL